MNKEEIDNLVKELRNGSNWLSGKHNVFSYNMAPKRAANLIEILSEISIPEIIAELRATNEWRIEGYGHWKDCTTSRSDAPNRAADVLEEFYKELFKDE